MISGGSVGIGRTAWKSFALSRHDLMVFNPPDDILPDLHIIHAGQNSQTRQHTA